MTRRQPVTSRLQSAAARGPAVAREQADLEGADDAELVIGVKRPRRGRVEGGEPGVKTAGAPGRRILVQLPAQREIGGRGRVQALQERAHVEPRAADDHRQRSAGPDLRDGGEGFAAEPRGVIALVRIHDIDQPMAEGGLLLPGRLAGADIHAAIDLARVGVDRLDRQGAGEPDRDGGLSDARGPHDDEERRGDHQVRPSSRLISRSDSRLTMGRPCGQK